MMTSHLKVLLCSFIAGQLAQASTFFVATNGADSNPGTEEQPWLSLKKAAASVKAGDTVRIRTGDYFVGPTWRVQNAGTAEQRITYQAFGDGEVRITGASVVPATAWTKVKGSIYSTPVSERPLAVFRSDLPLHDPGDRADIYKVDDLIPNSFLVADKTLYVWLADGSDPKDSVMRAAPGHVVSLYDCHHTVFDGLTVEFGFNGFKDQGKSTHHITIRNCTIRSITSQGIQPVAKNCVIERNLFQKIGSNKYQHGIYGSQPGTIICSNVFEDISGAGIHQYNQNHPAGGDCEFSGNIFRKPRAMTLRSGEVKYYTDLIAWGQGGNRIFGNTFLGEAKRSGISLNSISNRVWSNTFESPATAIQFHDGKPGNQVVSNLVRNPSRSFVVWPARALPQTLDHNTYQSAPAAARWEHDGKAHRSFADYQKVADETHSRYEEQTK